MTTEIDKIWNPNRVSGGLSDGVFFENIAHPVEEIETPKVVKIDLNYVFKMSLCNFIEVHICNVK